MYAVTQDFKDKMKADLRRVDAKVIIDYTDPTLDQSIGVSVTEQANVSYPQQTTDGVAQATHKWASLDGSWVLDGSYHLAPAPEDLSRYQMGWWSAKLAGPDGAFATPPYLTVTHIPRPVHTLRVVGDIARGEWPVDFQIDLYGPDGTLLKSQAVTGNAAVEWSMALPTPVLDVARQVLTITKWSHPGRQAKILEFFTSIQETYASGDVVEIRLLEEREASQGSLPVGNISANEISVRLANEGGKFDVTNRQSPLAGLLKPNRRIRAWLGAMAENRATEKPPTFTRPSIAYLSDGTQVATGQPRFELGKFGKAVMVEEGTTNLLTADQSSVETDLTGFTVIGGTLSRDTTKAWRGSASLKVVTQGSTSQEGFYIFPMPTASPNTVYTASVYLKGSGTVKLELAVLPGGSVVNSQIITLNNSWQRVTVTGTTKSDTTNVYLLVRTTTVQAITFWADGLQIEQKSYATSWTLGGTIRSPETMTIPTAGVLNPQEGTIEFWWNPLAKTPGTYPSLISTGTWTSDMSQDWLSIYWGSEWNNANEVRFGLINGTTKQGYLDQMITLNPSPFTWYFIAFKWDFVNTQTAKLLIYKPDGSLLTKQVSLASIPAPSFAGWDKFYVLQSWDNGPHRANSLIDDLRISNRARTDAEIAAAYASGQPLPVDEWTTWKQTFNGSIYPVEQVWVPLGTFWSLDWDSPDDTLEATVVARDRLELLRKSTYQPGAVQQNVSLYTLAEQVLQDAGLKSGEYWIDPALQQTVIPWAWLSPTSHRETIRIIAEAALAVVYADRDGVIRIESLGSVPDTTVATITADDYFPPLSSPSRQDQVANEIAVTTQPLRPAATAQEVYRSTTPVSVPAGQTVTVTAFYTQQPVIEAAASLDSPPAGVSIASATYYAWGADVRIQNTSTAQANVTLVINGKPLSVQGGEQVVARDQTSITDNGVLRYEFPANPLVQTLSQAQAIANALLASAKDPRRDIEVEWRGNPALELGDRVTVVGQDVHVIRQEITWEGALSARITGRKVT